MKLVCLSDTLLEHGFRVPYGDVLIHAGNGTRTGEWRETSRLLNWLAGFPHPHKLIIAGGMDHLFAKDPDSIYGLMPKGITYLCDSGVEIGGIKFWGTPWHPVSSVEAFGLPRYGEQLQEVWGRIPMDTDVLITHAPPHGILDRVKSDGRHMGCEELGHKLETLCPRIHVFGHVHSCYGIEKRGNTVFVNASICNDAFKPDNDPVVVNL